MPYPPADARDVFTPEGFVQNTTPGFWRPLTPTPHDYDVFRAGYRYFTPLADLKADFTKTPLTPEPDQEKRLQTASTRLKKAAQDENQFRKIAPNLYVAFDTVTVDEDVAAQIEDEQQQIRRMREQMESLRENGQVWAGKDKTLKDLMSAYGVAVFLDVEREPEYIHCFERTQELERNIARQKSDARKKKTIKVFRLLSVAPGSASRGIKVKIGDHTMSKPAEKVVTTSDKAATAKMAPVPRP